MTNILNEASRTEKINFRYNSQKLKTKLQSSIKVEYQGPTERESNPRMNESLKTFNFLFRSKNKK